MKTKQQVLTENGFELIIGYQFDYGKDEDYDNIIITKKEIEDFLKTEPQTYYFKEGYGSVMDEESAWDDFMEEHCDNNKLDLSEEEFDKLMEIK